MSAASKGKALRPWKVREQVARGIAHAERGPRAICQQCIGAGINFDCVCDCPRDSFAVYHRDSCQAVGCKACAGSGSGRGERALAIFAGALFDVHAARERARSLVSLADEQTTFEDWARGLNKGPENREPGAHVGDLCLWLVEIIAMVEGEWSLLINGRTVVGEVFFEAADAGSVIGWFSEALHQGPGWDECYEDGPGLCVVGRVRDVEVRCPPGGEWSATLIEALPELGGWPGNLAREWARQGGGRRAPMGRSLARLGQHVLDAIEGQPSECQACEGHGHVWRDDEVPESGTRPCKSCQGTGHNLAGYLPEPEVSPQLRRALLDSHLACTMERPANCWMEGLGDRAWADSLRLSRRCARVTPRGEHREHDSFAELAATHRAAPKGSPEREAALDALISAKQWGRVSNFPHWFLGELKHAQQRRDLEARRLIRGGAPTRGTWADIETAMYACPGVQSVDIARAFEADPWTVMISFTADTRETAQRAVEAAEERRPAYAVFSYTVTVTSELTGSVTPIRVTGEFSIV